MPFIAVCPYCQAGRIRAPESALGLTAPCPRCQNHFTLIDSGETLEEAQKRSGLRGRPEIVPNRGPATSSPAGGMIPATDSGPDAPTAIAEHTSLARPPRSAPPLRLPPISEDDLGVDPLRAPVLVAFVLAGIALVAAQFPYGRFGTVGLAGIGLLVAAACWFGSQRPILPMVATALNGVILFVAFVMPSWIGLDSWRPRADWKGGAIVKAIGPDGVEAPAGEWVLGDHSWQLDDVRVRLAAVSIGPIELNGSGGRKVPSKKQYLQIRVRVSNAGSSRPLTFKGWELSPLPGSAPPRLTDSVGHVLSIAQAEAGGESLVRPVPGNLNTGQSADQLFLFEPPAGTVDYLRLELPPSAFGGFQPIRFQIPATLIAIRSPK